MVKKSKSNRLTHEQLKQTALAKPHVREEYNRLQDEFVLLRELVRARQLAGLTQEDVAESMHTTTSVIGRLETGGGKKRHSPTIATLQRYAEAVGCHLSIHLEPPGSKTATR